MRWVLYWVQLLNISFLLTRAYKKDVYYTRLVYRIFLRQTYFDMQDVLSFNLHLSHGGLPLAGDHREVSRGEESATPGQDQVSCS